MGLGDAALGDPGQQHAPLSLPERHLRHGAFAMRRAWWLLLLCSCRTGLPGGSLGGRVVIVGESQAGGIVVTASGAETTTATTEPDGSYRFSALTLGAYLVSASVPD